MVDLFGEIPVSWREVRLWLWKVPAWHNGHSSERARDNYVRQYNVIGKIQRQKAQGRLQAIFGDECCPHCLQRLETALLPSPPNLTPSPRATILQLVRTSRKGQACDTQEEKVRQAFISASST